MVDLALTGVGLTIVTLKMRGRSIHVLHLVKIVLDSLTSGADEGFSHPILCVMLSFMLISC